MLHDSLRGIFFDRIREKSKVWALPTAPLILPFRRLSWHLGLPVWDDGARRGHAPRLHSRRFEASMDDQPIESQRGALTVSTDRARLDVDAVLTLLRTTFWGRVIARETMVRAMANSLCFGLYDTGRLIGFGRVVTDRATYAYWTDVVTAPEYRGLGLGQWLCQCMLDHPDLQGLRRVGLVTRDAERLYTRLGFTTDTGALTYMERRAPSEPVT